MKKLIFTFIAVMCCTVMNAQDVTFTADAYTYIIRSENTVGIMNAYQLSGSVVIPATVTNPDDGKTYNVTRIEDSCFLTSKGITSVTIPEGVTYIGIGAFRQTALTSISLPEGLISIGESAFYYCTKLQGDLVIPSTVKSIGDEAFKYCPFLKSVTIKGGRIGSQAFMNCSDVTSISLQEGVTSIGSEAFYDCSIQGNLVIPSTVKSIGNGAFGNNSSLTSVTIKGGSIGDYAFSQSYYLTSISLQEGVTSIGSHAFGYVDSLEEDYLIIPSTVKSIGNGAFSNVDVTTVKVFALVPPELGGNAFGGNVSFYVPDVEKYKECNGWKNFQDIKLLTEFRLGDKMRPLNETGEHFGQDLTFNDKDLYVSCSDFTANKLTYSRTFKDTNWQALYVPFAMSYDDWKDNFDVAAINNFHEYTDKMGQTTKTELEVRLVKDHTLKPNHPYLIRTKREDKNNPQTIEVSTKKMYKSEENSIDCSSVERKYTFTGTYREIAGLKTNDYIFMSGGKLCKATNDQVILPAQRWYLKIESRGSQIGEGNTSEAKPMEFDIKLLDDEPTGIDEITVTRTPLKNISEAIYNLNGMRVNGNYKGIVIKNGKKYVVK